MSKYENQIPYSLKDLHEIENRLPNPFKMDRKRVTVSSGFFDLIDEDRKAEKHDFHKVEAFNEPYIVRFWVCEDFKGVAFHKKSIHQERLDEYLRNLEERHPAKRPPRINPDNFNKLTGF